MRGINDWLERVIDDLDEDQRIQFENAALQAFKASSSQVAKTIDKIVRESKASKNLVGKQITLLTWAEAATKVLMYLHAQASINGNLTENLQENAETWYEQYGKNGSD